ncbi:MAG: DUF4845 domain-containing protein [Chromatiales bacterium]|nr:DUF4845 domain-containing protein [Chromatiales bacterium]
MRGPARQAGMSYFGWLIAIGLAGVIVVVGLRLMPIYLEYFTVKTTLENVAAEAGVSKKSKRYIWDRIEKRFEVNDVTGIKIDNLTVEIDNNNMATLRIAYEKRSKLIGNLDVVAVFDTQVKAN